MKKNILVFGAGKSATSLISYLLEKCSENNWSLTVADNDYELALAKINGHPHAKAAGVDVMRENDRKACIKNSDIVISLLPPSLHYLIAVDCLGLGKNLLTASYTDDKISALRPQIEEKGLLFLCEMGLDPGIDHMSAMKLIHNIQQSGGSVSLFRSHCGGLVAPESDNNPWHYKISWNPKNVVNAGKGGAVFLDNGTITEIPYTSIFDATRLIDFPGLGKLSWYPNRDSLSYIDLYNLRSAKTFMRTTLRYPEFCFGWNNLIDLHLTDENIFYDTDGLTLAEFFRYHLSRHRFAEWVQEKLTSRIIKTRQLIDDLQDLVDKKITNAEGFGFDEELMMVDPSGDLKNINLDAIRITAAKTVAGQLKEASLTMQQLFFLGMDDDKTLINKGRISVPEILQFAIEKKWALAPSDKDMVLMLHELEYTLEGEKHKLESSLMMTGTGDQKTAMAAGVGLPLGIAACMVLKEELPVKGLHIPIIPEIYIPVLKELEQHGIIFKETTSAT